MGYSTVNCKVIPYEEFPGDSGDEKIEARFVVSENHPNYSNMILLHVGDDWNFYEYFDEEAFNLLLDPEYGIGEENYRDFISELLTEDK